MLLHQTALIPFRCAGERQSLLKKYTPQCSPEGLGQVPPPPGHFWLLGGQ